MEKKSSELFLPDIITKEWAINCDILLSDCCNSIVKWDREIPMCSNCKQVTKILKI